MKSIICAAVAGSRGADAAYGMAGVQAPACAQ